MRIILRLPSGCSCVAFDRCAATAFLTIAAAVAVAPAAQAGDLQTRLLRTRSASVGAICRVRANGERVNWADVLEVGLIFG